MAIPRPETALEIGLALGGVVVAFFVVLPLVPLVLDLVFGTLRSVFDVIVPGGRTYE